MSEAVNPLFSRGVSRVVDVFLEPREFLRRLGRSRQIDSNQPPRIVQGFDFHAPVVLPGPVALGREPTLKAFEGVGAAHRGFPKVGGVGASGGGVMRSSVKSPNKF